MDAQAHRPITIDTSLGDQITFHSMGGIEGLSQLYAYDIHVLSPRADLDASNWLGQSVTVLLQRSGLSEEARPWNGVVSAFEYVGSGDDGASRYRITMRPWLWYLTRRVDCRIFQNLRIPDILTKVFRDRGFTDFESVLQEDYGTEEYVVQYRETDFHFVSRLMERAGIYYFFRHAHGRHTLVLADSPHVHDPAAGAEQIPFAPPDANRAETGEHVTAWRVDGSVESSRYAHADFDFKRPNMRLYSLRDTPQSGSAPALEIYDYPGGFSSYASGDEYAQLRLEQRRVDVQIFVGESTARGLTVGATFELTDHLRDDLNASYLVTWARYRLVAPEIHSIADIQEAPFSCRFGGMRADVTYRPALKTPRALVQGPQTATVVGPEGREIWTDQYGRIKVQFHWDREGRYDENSSCFVRVSQPWAGTGWGAQFIPRIGQEVVIDFLEGDPDRPLITGSVYNGTHMPAFKLPDRQTQSGFRSRSTPDGTQVNGNEIRFDDLTGLEELFIQAEKTQTTWVKGDQSLTVLGQQSEKVARNQLTNVGGSRSSSIGGDETLTIARSHVVDVGGARREVTRGSSEERIEGGALRSVAGPIADHVLGGRRIDTVGPLAEHVIGSKTETIDFQSTVSVGGGLSTNVKGNARCSVDGSLSAFVGIGSTPTNASVTVNGDVTIGATGQVTIRGDEKIVLVCGDTSLTITPDTLAILVDTLKLAAQSTMQVTAGSSAIKVADAVDVVSPKINLMSQGASLHLDSAASLLGGSVKLGAGQGGSTSGSSSSAPPNTMPFTTKILDAMGKPIAGKAYLLIASGMRFIGTTGGDGSVTANIPKETQTMHLRITTSEGPPPAYVNFSLSVVEPQAASSREGAISRLLNLGYLTHGQPDTPTLSDALSRFQRDQSITVTGLLDGPTASALQSAHGH
jgi:type VI secretion system secreted protein VgrG